jgi:hypothetical protein
LQRKTWQHGCGPNRPCGRKRGADCPGRHGGGLVIVEPKSLAGRRATMLMVLNVPDRAVMDVMGWSADQHELRYLHVPHELYDRIADQVGRTGLDPDGRRR